MAGISLARARSIIRGALKHARAMEDPIAAIQPLINLAYLMTNLGRYAEAHGYFEEALTDIDRTGFKQELGRLLYLFGRLVAFEGDYEKARAIFERCRAINVRQGNRFQVARADRWLGRTHAT